ncbi:MAG TPA: hypothetical protein VK066_16375 [Chloroflexota bacterium]|nr:hypothetical protein [Chloroflexota bacterium]
MRCSFPYCFREAATRCDTCRQVYCTRHCGERVSDSGAWVWECDVCDPLTTPKRARSPVAGALRAAAAVAAFLAVVSLGIAIDVTVRGHGFVALWVFAAGFVALVVHLGY